MMKNKEKKDEDSESWNTQLSTPSEKGSKIDEDDKLFSSGDEMPEGASNLFEEWGSKAAEGTKDKVSSWRRGR